ncbi:MAG: DNA/RNA nuclease SfsA [Cyanobacteria bacterium P01_H01_bin.121]
MPSSQSSLQQSPLYQYPPLLQGTLQKRYKRFFADIELDSGELITAHCPNTGPMTGVCTIGNRVAVSQSDNPKRKLPYTWEMIEAHDNEPTWVGTNTSLPNRIVDLALAAHVIPELGDYSQIEREVRYGQEKSRIDFRLQAGSGTATAPIYLEVKNTTWVQGRLALFPDTVTTRGQKHLRELMTLLPATRAVMLYFVNRADCTEFSPGDVADPEYGRLLRAAIAKGLEVLPCCFEVTPQGVDYLGLLPLVI